ncbi:MAG TPA: glycosyltransferase [Solirubrobacteraceae bacterium]|jgi:glycosyltransferase involved in cell wall biosynthesis|nr:glycosyltransferase [Solirubrobacteraceae bacterium]
MASPPAVELCGYLDAAVGVGEAARRYVGALRSAHVPVIEREIPLPGRDAAHAQLPFGPRPADGEITVNLLCLNPEQMVPYLQAAGPSIRDGRASIGVWSWEVDVVPPGWRAAAEGLAEVWTYSRFAAELIGAAIDVPVFDVPPPIAPAGLASTLSVALPQGFRVLVMFDFLSTLERKNPLGAIQAFVNAFEPDDGAVLIVKSVNGRHRPDRLAEVQAALAERADTVLLDRTMSAAERDALIAACDCCLSLHRSEGHGLALAEAMAAGKPVVATAYGGNTEFMNEDNSYPVAWTPTRVGAGVEHYPPQASWAEPDLEHAAKLLREVRGNREDAMRRSSRAKADVEARLTPSLIGAQMRRRLEALPAAGTGGSF